MAKQQPERRPREDVAFIGGPNVGVSVPIHTLSDDYHDEPAEPEDSDRIPEPEPPSLIKRVVDRFRGRASAQ